MGGPEVTFVGIRKVFGPVAANDDVSFSIQPGQIHGVVGENGAGKSTIMKILYGLYRADGGEILFRGSRVDIRSPKDALALGIGMVHQHFMLVPTLTVWENVVLGPTSEKLDPTAILSRLRALIAEFGFSVDPTAVVESLPVGHQQQVELLKLLYRDLNFFILDEPTAVLTPAEVDQLFERLRLLVTRGKTIVLITHKLREILRYSDTVTVMRQGKTVGTYPTAALTEEALAEHIIGRRLMQLPPRAPVATAAPALSVRDLKTPGGRAGSLKGLSFDVRPGEILGIAGVEGNGQDLLVEVLAGIARDFEGEVTLGGKPLRGKSTYALKQEGLAVIPPDRLREAVVLDFPLWENFVLGHHREKTHTRGPWLDRSQIQSDTAKCLAQFDVRPRNPLLPIRSLSGGNQQKLVLGRELRPGVKLVLAAHPTRGVDIGAIEFIHSEFLKLRAAGVALVVISSELDEILALADRIVVLFDGKLHGPIERADATETQLGMWMTGGSA